MSDAAVVTVSLACSELTAMRRAVFLVAYDGGYFRGFARNADVASVQGALEEALSRIARGPVEVTGAGRTDAGVHAWGQVVTCDLPVALDLDDVARRLNKLVAPAIAIRAVRWSTDPDLHARFSATARHYRYHVWNAPYPHPLLAGRAWHVSSPLARWALDAASDPLIGEHDFSSFCRTAMQSDGTSVANVRRVLAARWSEVDEHQLRFDISATAFCHQMVRSVVGTLVDVGVGKLTPGDVRPILVARDRAAAGTVAPAQGLVLWAVDYSAPIWA